MFKSSKNNKEGRAGMLPVHPIELSEKSKRTRIILAIIAVVLALVMFAVFFVKLLSKDPGWQEIKPDSTVNNCSSDFKFQYYLGDMGISATAEYRQLKETYTAATERAYRVFHETLLEDGLGNLAYVSANPNETVTVDPLLYSCLEKICASADRTIYMGNVAVVYSNAIFYDRESMVAQYDPTRDPEMKAYVEELASYANDPNHIDLAVLGNNQVQLKISDAYAALFKDYELERYLDLGWMKNAFIVDYLAQAVTETGYTNGYISSVDGFTRNLDVSGRGYKVNIFTRTGADVVRPAAISYQGATSLVDLRNFPQTEVDRWRCFAYSNGQVVSTYIDPADGMSKSSVPALLAYSQAVSCGEMVLELATVFIADELDTAALVELYDRNIGAVWCENDTLRYTDQKLTLELEDASYTAHHVK